MIISVPHPKHRGKDCTFCRGRPCASPHRKKITPITEISFRSSYAEKAYGKYLSAPLLPLYF